MNFSIFSSDRALAIAATTALGFAALFGVSEMFVRDQVAPQDNFRRHVAFFHRATAANVVLGDSHAARGFGGAPGFINLSFPSENIKRLAWKARRYFARRNPGRIILQADPHMFAAYRLRVPLAPYPAAFANGGRTAPVYLLEERHRPKVIAYWNAALRNGGTLRSNVQFAGDGSLMSGGNLALQPARVRLLVARQRIRLHQPLLPVRRRPAEEIYRNLVRWLVTRGGQVCLVSYPVSPTYLREMTRAPTAAARKRWLQTLAFFRVLAGETGSTYVDMRRRYTNPALFRDIDHLNRVGAQKFAPTLVRACFGAPA
jgi:hypothetical protein